MKWVYLLPVLYLFYACPAGAQVDAGGAVDLGGQIDAALPAVVAQNNATVVYDSNTGRPIMVVVNANNIKDPAFNPPNSTQVSINPLIYNQMGPDDLQLFIGANAPAVAVVQP